MRSAGCRYAHGSSPRTGPCAIPSTQRPVERIRSCLYAKNVAATCTNYFLDTEFEEDGHTIMPISIGIVSQRGTELYIEIAFDEERAEKNAFVRRFVLPRLTWRREDRLSRVDARLKIQSFIGRTRPKFWAYYASYDWVLFSQLFGTMLRLPTGWPCMCMDLQQWWLQLGKPSCKPPPSTDEHSAIADARWNWDLWKNLRKYATDNGLPLA
jgi:hypothetical protein